MLRSKKGQNTLEYAIILTAIIAAIIFAATTYFKPAVENSVSHISNEMLQQVNRIDF